MASIPTDRVEADRIAWLEQHPDDVTYLLGEAAVPPAEYWAGIEDTVHWSGHVLSRRVDELWRSLWSVFRR